MGKTDKLKEFDPALSKNHSKSIKYRLRVQQETEAEEEIKEYEDRPSESELDDAVQKLDRS